MEDRRGGREGVLEKMRGVSFFVSASVCVRVVFLCLLSVCHARLPRGCRGGSGGCVLSLSTKDRRVTGLDAGGAYL